MIGAGPSPLAGASVADALLEPTVIYVRAILALLRSDLDVRGLAHITGGGLLNLLRLGDGVGFEIDSPLPVPPVFELIAELGEVPTHEMWEVFNMGCGFCAIVVPQTDAEAAVELLERPSPGHRRRSGGVTDRGGVVEVPDLRIEGGADGLGSA